MGLPFTLNSGGYRLRLEILHLKTGCLSLSQSLIWCTTGVHPVTQIKSSVGGRSTLFWGAQWNGNGLAIVGKWTGYYMHWRNQARNLKRLQIEEGQSSDGWVHLVVTWYCVFTLWCVNLQCSLQHIKGDFRSICYYPWPCVLQTTVSLNNGIWVIFFLLLLLVWFGYFTLRHCATAKLSPAWLLKLHKLFQVYLHKVMQCSAKYSAVRGPPAGVHLTSRCQQRPEPLVRSARSGPCRQHSRGRRRTLPLVLHLNCRSLQTGDFCNEWPLTLGSQIPYISPVWFYWLSLGLMFRCSEM